MRDKSFTPFESRSVQESVQQLEYISDVTVEAVKTDKGLANEYKFCEYNEFSDIEGEHLITRI